MSSINRRNLSTRASKQLTAVSYTTFTGTFISSSLMDYLKSTGTIEYNEKHGDTVEYGSNWNVKDDKVEEFERHLFEFVKENYPAERFVN